MNNISIVFSKRSSFSLFSSLIMLGLGTPFSHVAIKLIDGDTGQTVIYQASGLAVNCVSESEFLSQEVIIDQKDFQINDNKFIAGKAWAIAQLGKPYGVMAILGFALQIILGIVGIKINNPFKENGSSWVCSQLASGFLEVCEDIDLDLTNMTPKALYSALINQNIGQKQ
jgi:hypothetical protein